MGSLEETRMVEFADAGVHLDRAPALRLSALYFALIAIALAVTETLNDLRSFTAEGSPAELLSGDVVRRAYLGDAAVVEKEVT